MRRMWCRALWIPSIAFLFAQAAWSADLPTAKSIAAEMGVGWNLGNTMELIGVQPVPTKALFDSVKAAGFKTVRIPAAWDMHADQTTHAIDAAWMAQVKKVVDDAIADSLFVILNIHWDGGWLEGKIDSAATRPAMLATLKAKQGTFWKQIATTFRNYDRHLVFASANEPAVEDKANLGILMSIHQIFVDTVRATGGNNASRSLIVQGPSTSFEHTADWVTSLPTDRIAGRLMVEAHFYPYQYCLMSQPANWGTTAYPFYYWGKQYHSTTDTDHNPTWGEEAYVDSEFNLVKPKFLDKGIPVVVGEFGAMKRLTPTGDNLRLATLSRRHFYNYVTKAALDRGMVPVAWDAGGKGDGTMSVFDRKNEGAVYDLGLLNAIRTAAGLSRIPGDTTSDYSVATGDNSLRILYSAKDSGFGQIPLPVAKADMSGCDTVLVRALVKGSTAYDSAGVRKSGFVSLSLVTMSDGWKWREATWGALTMDGWATYRIPVSSNLADTSVHALVPAARSAIDFFALQAYSKGFRGAVYVDWIAFKAKGGASDTIYGFNQTAPEDASGNVQTLSLVPTSAVLADTTWKTATTSRWITASVGSRLLSGERLSAVVSVGQVVATWSAPRAGTAEMSLFDLRGERIWSALLPVAAGTNSLRAPVAPRGGALLRVRQDGRSWTTLVLGR